MKNTFLVLDTETCDLSGSVYDVGYTICDKYGNILQTRNALVREIFTNGKKMMGAFYAKKLFSHYAPMLESDDIKMETWETITGWMNQDIADFQVTVICAYNAGFDFRVMNATHRMLGYTGKVLNAPLKTLDLWQFACETKLSQKTYKKLATKKGWVSPKGNIKTGAEFCYRFCSGEWGFIEDHTALSDALIETKILADCMATKKKIPYGKINQQPWRIVNPSAKGNDPHIHGSKVA